MLVLVSNFLGRKLHRDDKTSEPVVVVDVALARDGFTLSGMADHGAAEYPPPITLSLPHFSFRR